VFIGFLRAGTPIAEQWAKLPIMIDALFNQPNYAGAKKMLDAAVLRQKAIANNLAHLESPNYRRVDLSPAFESELRHALEGRDVARINGLRPTLESDATAVASTRDGNTVKLEDELVRMNQNTLTHAVESQLITGSLVKLRLAITGRSA